MATQFKVKRRIESVRFVVSGSGEFPFDLLRKQCCFPIVEHDARLLESSGERRLVLEHRDNGQAPAMSVWRDARWPVVEILDDWAPGLKNYKLKRAVEAVRFVVQGGGDFPFDMLRYDCCFPVHEAEAKDLGNRGPKLVTLEHRGNGMAPTAGRWSSFLWKVVDIVATRDWVTP
jgi:hypothetical protein